MGGYILLIKKIQSLKQDKSNFMEKDSHKKTWDNFTKFVLWGTIAIIVILILMAIFLL